MLDLEKYLSNLPKLHVWGGVPSDGGLWADLLRQIVRLVEQYNRPVILETGSGNSTIAFLLSGVENLISVSSGKEVFDRVQAYCLENNIETSSLRRIDERSEIALPKIVEEGVLIDIALIDGGHGWPTVFVDFCYINMMLRENGTLIIDDIHLHSVKELARLLVSGNEFSLIHQDSKTVIFRKITNEKFLPHFQNQRYIMKKTADDDAAGKRFILD